jgi:hypothetical protein
MLKDKRNSHRLLLPPLRLQNQDKAQTNKNNLIGKNN